MPRAHLSKRLPDAVAIQLFAEHHIVHVRRRKNGEIVAVKHSTWGWVSPQQYYAMQKAHELMPLLQEFVRGGYQFKAWMAGLSVGAEIAGYGVNIPVGMGIIGTEVVNFFTELAKEPKDWGMLTLRAYALFGPFGDILQIADFLGLLGPVLAGLGAGGPAAGDTDQCKYRYSSFLAGDTANAQSQWDAASSEGCKWPSKVPRPP